MCAAAPRHLTKINQLFLLQTTNALNLQDFLEHFELTLLCILGNSSCIALIPSFDGHMHPRYNSIPAENRMGNTFSLKITDKVLYIQHLDRSRYDTTNLFRFNDHGINHDDNILMSTRKGRTLG